MPSANIKHHADCIGILYTISVGNLCIILRKISCKVVATHFMPSAWLIKIDVVVFLIFMYFISFLQKIHVMQREFF